jgi:heme-degrading monooxygenase HmoA
VIARVWRGRTPAAKADAYAAYLARTGLVDYRATSGNRGVLALRRVEGEEAEFLLVSFWDSFEAVKRFAGPDAEKAYYYPEDEAFLLEPEPRVSHYQVFSGEPPKGSGASSG